MRELKPCPFCGGTEIEFEPAWFNGIGIFPPRIGCPKCDYTIQGKVGFLGKRTETKVKYSNNLLVNWWNKRAYEKGKGND